MKTKPLLHPSKLYLLGCVLSNKQKPMHYSLQSTMLEVLGMFLAHLLGQCLQGENDVQVNINVHLLDARFRN